MGECNELVQSVSIDNLLSQRQAMVERLQVAENAMLEVEELSRTAFGDDSAAPGLYCRRSNTSFPGNTNKLTARIDAAAWAYLMSESGLYTFMDNKARSKWQEDIGRGSVPELTRENIKATFRALFETRGIMFERGVIDCFRALSWDYKTNSPCLFGKRIIVEYLLDSWGNHGCRYVTGPGHSGCNKLDDLIRVMSVLDGKPEPDHRQGTYHALRKVAGYNKPLTKDPVEIAGMISVRCYKNGNGHVTFLRRDLVDKLNEIIAKHHPDALPAKR
jgi:hypothetical protein